MTPISNFNSRDQRHSIVRSGRTGGRVARSIAGWGLLGGLVACAVSCGSSNDAPAHSTGVGGTSGDSSAQGGNSGRSMLETGGTGTNAGAGGGGGASGGSDGGTQSGPPGPRMDTLLNDGWKFNKADASGAEKVTFDDGAWTAATLPHTWNAQDGQDGPTTPYYRGVGWYRKHYNAPADLADKKIYLQFDGSNIVTDVFVNGTAAGTHQGGFAAFRFDVTSLMKAGADNVIAVKVNNAAGVDGTNGIVAGSPTVNVPPLSADFTFFGGLYRSVHLLVTSQVAINPMDFGSSGVYLKPTNVTAVTADLAVTVKLSNSTAGPKTLDVKATVLDATGAEVQTLTGMQTVPANGTADAVITGKVTGPHLWNGLVDPYLYRVRVDVLDGTLVADSVTQPLGFRSFVLDANSGFSLNGKYLDLHGVSKHQDHKDKGWAIADADTDADFAIIKELGATAVRLPHYQHAQHTYDVTDRMGYVVWAETPVVNRINNTPEFAANAEQQLTELILQNYNHPSIVFWSVGNETLLKTGPNPDTLIAHLADVVTKLDATRFPSYAANAGDQTNPVNWHGTAHGFNEYQGWYFGKVADFATWADSIHQSHPTGAVGVTEYGAGGAITQHAVVTAASDGGGDHTGSAHTEEYQSYYHEGNWAAMSTRPFLWGKFVWNAFDFASDGRTEGSTPGLNDKGLVTFDRLTKKDSFYWYKANWSTDPFVYITSRRFTGLAKAGTSIKVYSNATEVDLTLNGTSLGKKTAANHAFVWDGVTWASGANVVEATATAGATSLKDSVTWTK